MDLIAHRVIKWNCKNVLSERFPEHCTHLPMVKQTDIPAPKLTPLLEL